MLERFARGKHFTQGNPLLAVVTLRMKRKFSMNFTTSLMHCKTTFPAHIPVKDRLQGKGEIIPWLKAPICRHCAFVSHPCTHMTINVRCQQCSPRYQASPSEQRSQGGAKETRLPCPPRRISSHDPSHPAPFTECWFLQWSAKTSSSKYITIFGAAALILSCYYPESNSLISTCLLPAMG